MTTRQQLIFERQRMYLKMVEESGATPEGQPPRPEDIAALRQMTKVNQAADIFDAFLNSTPPPTFDQGHIQ